MIVFWVIAAVLVVAALVLLAPPLWRGRGGEEGTATDAGRIELHRQRLAELEADRASGVIGEDAYQAARTELERAALDELQQPEPGQTQDNTKVRIGAGIGLLVLVPAVTVALYLGLGRVELLSPPSPMAATHDTADRQTLARAVNHLVARLRAQPANRQGWLLLGRSYVQLGRFEDAELAYARAVDLDPDDPGALLDQAEAAAMAAGDRLEGKPERLIRRALRISPGHPKALWLAGIAAYRAERFEEAIEYWRRLEKQLAPGSEEAKVVAANIDKARHQLADQSQAGASGAAIDVAVAIDPSLAQRFGPDSVVYVLARPSSGSRMPLAVVRKTLADLPITVRLDDTLAMAPQAKLSQAEEVMIVARVSQSGSAAAAAGDLEGRAGPIDVGETKRVELTIDQVVE